MWWESLPSIVIVGMSLFSVSIFTYTTNKLFLGNPYKRLLYSNDDSHHFLRDSRISGTFNPYQQKGLESLEDEDVDNTKTTSNETNEEIKK